MMTWESFQQDPLKMRCLIPPLNIHLLNITLISKFQANISPYDQSFEKKKKNLYSSRDNNICNKTCSRQNTLKMKCLLSPLNLHLMKITLRQNSKPIFHHLIKVLKKIRIIDIVQVKTTHGIKHVLINNNNNLEN